MITFSKSLIALIAAAMLCGVEARADSSFTITNVQGSLFVNASADGGPPILRLPPQFYFAGPGLSVTRFSPVAFGGDRGSVSARDICQIQACGAGSHVGTNSYFSGTLAETGAMAVVNGVEFHSVQLTGSLYFVSQPILLPAFVDGDYRETIPFTFSGDITGFLPNTSTPIFSATLSGQGRATFLFWNTSMDLLNPHYLLYSIEYHFEPMPISIDIKPATFPNSINPQNKGKIAVAILTTDSFDATAVDPTTVLFGATGIEAAPVQSATEDVDGDGDIDLVLHFVTQETGITCGTASAALTGALFSGVRIKGSDSIVTVGCN
jgi:hypothetical protein